MIIGKDQPITFQLDTGSSVNMIPASYVDAGKIRPYHKRLKMWNNAETRPKGTCRESVLNPRTGKRYFVEFIVFEEADCTPLLSLETCERMKLVTINDNEFDHVNTIRQWTTEFSDVFDNKPGTLPGKQHLTVDESVKPVVMPARRVPVAIRDKLKAELDRMVELKIIEPVSEPTPWVSQMVTTEKKSGALRVCIDPRELNKALQRERFTLPVLEDSTHELRESRVFTKADLASGYWHIELDEESSLLTTFQSCHGRYRWLRLPFGISVASEIFQKRLQDMLGDLKGIIIVADDIVIHASTQAEHDEYLRALLQRCQEVGIKLNPAKFETGLSCLTFLGHRITKDGLQADPEKVQAISNMKAPSDRTELRRFLGMVTYLAKLIPLASDILHPLQSLMKKEVHFQWSSTQQDAFNKIKACLSNDTALAFFDPTKEVTLQNDASEYGLGSVLLQDGRPVGYASRSLKPAERNYAQIEKEMLAAVFGLEKFHHYTYGASSVTVITDHKPLVPIMNKPLSKAPKRLQAMMMRMQPYTVNMVYQPGSQLIIADTLSRAPLPVSASSNEHDDFSQVNNLQWTPVKQERLTEIERATDKDNVMMKLKARITTGWPEKLADLEPELKPYFSYRDELTLQDGLIVRGDRIVIPASMRLEVKRKVHAGHMGINSCIRRARDLVFWPGMSKEIQQYVEACETCARYASTQQPETLHLHPVPNRPWSKVGIDLFSISGRDYLVTVDYMSNFYEVDYLPETTAATVITKIKYHFARHGIPDIVITGNGPQFACGLFRQFASTWEFDHQPISPGNSKANGAAEAAVKDAKKMMKRCIAEKTDPYLGLLNVRNTPTEGINTSPVQRLFGRRTKTVTPTSASRLQPRYDVSDEVAKKEEQRRSNAATQDRSRKDLRQMRPGEGIWIQPISGKTKEWTRGTVEERTSERAYDVRSNDNGRIYRRDRQRLRVDKTLCGQAATTAHSEKHDDSSPVVGTPNAEATPFPDATRTGTPVMQPRTTRSGRVVKTPVKLDI